MEAIKFLAALRSRLRQVLVTDAVARGVRLVLASLVILAVLDFTAALPSVLRLIAIVALLGAVIYGFYQRLIRPLGQRMDDRALAQLVERRSSESQWPSFIKNRWFEPHRRG